MLLMRFPILHLFIALTLCGAVWAQDPVLDQLVDPISLDSDGTTLSIVFDDLRADTSDTNYEAQQSDDITRWLGIPDQNAAVDQGNDRFLITAPDPGTERKFYRILVYSTSAEDSDGDGLSNNLENAEGTDPDKADTDGDGFNDGMEFSLGTDPNDANSFPDLANLPSVQFEEIASVQTEGSGTVGIPIIFDRSFSGTVTYSIHATSTAVSGTDFQAVSGSLSVSGTTATIPITSIDNAILNRDRLIAIDLEGSALYRTGGRSRHVICLCDNDAYWSGNLVTGRMTRDFRTEIVRHNGTTSVWFVAGANYDGIGDPTDESTSQTEGLIPEGRHAATVVSDTSSQFEVSVAVSTVGQSKFFGDSLTATRTLTLTANPDLVTPGYDQITDYRIQGSYTEACGFNLSNQTAPNESTGTFALVRNAPEGIAIPNL